MVIASATAAPYSDLPSHISRASAIMEWALVSDSRGSLPFYVSLSFTPYLLGDLILGALVDGFGWRTGGALWATAVYLSLPIGFWWLVRIVDRGTFKSVLALTFGSYLATTWFFQMGFHHFQLSAALAIMATAASLLIVRSPAVTFFHFFVYVFFVVSCYLVHLAGFVMLGITIGALCSITVFSSNSRPWVKASSLVLPFVVLVLIHIALAAPAESAEAWGGVSEKALRLGSIVLRFDPWIEALVISPMLLGAILIRLSSPSASSPIGKIAVVLAIVYLCLYFVIPRSTTTGFDIDSRALFFGMLAFALACCMGIGSHGIRVWTAVCLVFFSSLLNSVVFSLHIMDKNDWMKDFQTALGEIQQGSSILPIAAKSPVLRSDVNTHPADLAWVIGRSFTPYMFSKSNKGPQWYFDYKTPLKAPPRNWYTAGALLDWSEYRGRFDYLIIDSTHDPARLPPEAQKVFSNRVAFVYRWPSDVTR